MLQEYGILIHTLASVGGASSILGAAWFVRGAYRFFQAKRLDATQEQRGVLATIEDLKETVARLQELAKLPPVEAP